MVGKMAQLHIKAQKEESTGEEKEKKKVRKFLFPEEMLYLTYLAEFNNGVSLNSATARQEW